MSFLHPGLLGLAALFAVPLVIHLLNKRRYQRVRWAAMDFLLKAYKQNRRRVRLENLLLLLLRCAIPILLALAIARPRTSSSISPALGSSGKHHIIVLDRSYSLAYSEGGSETPFTRMRLAASALVDQIANEENDKVSLVLVDEQVTTPVRGDLSVARAKRALAALEAPRDGGSALLPALRECQKLIAETPEPAQLYVFSDFQRRFLGTGSDPDGTEAAADEENSRDSKKRKSRGKPDKRQELIDVALDLIDAGAQLRFLPFAPSGKPQNTQVLSLDIEPSNAVAKVMAKAHVRIRHRGSARRNTVATLTIDGKNPQTRSLQLDPGEVKSLEFPVRFVEEGQHILELRLGEDALAVDDVRRRAVRVRDRIRVLLVEGRDPSRSASILSDENEVVLSESFLWNRLLDPTLGRGRDELLTFQTTVIDEDRFQADPSYFSGQDVIALLGVSGPRPGVAKRLTEFVAAGGGLLIAPGPGSTPDLYNSRLFGIDGKKGPMPLRLLDIRGYQGILGNVQGGSIPESYSTPWIRVPPHELLADFQEGTRGEVLQRTPVYRYFGTSSSDAPKNTRIVLGLRGAGAAADATLLALRPFGRGHCALLTSGLSRRPGRWNRLDEIWNSLPLIHSITHFLAKETPDRQNRLVGQALSAWLPERPSALYMSSPGSETRTPLSIGRSDVILDGPEFTDASDATNYGYRSPAFGRTNKAGIYSLQAEFSDRTQAARSIPFAVNVLPDEGLLEYASVDELRKDFPRVRVQSALEIESGADVDRGSSDLGSFFLWLVLLFAFSETILASLLGGRRR